LIRIIGDQGGGVSYKGVFTTEIIATADHSGTTGLLCSELYHDFPVAFLEKVI
jgi:hypothetical protein